MVLCGLKIWVSTPAFVMVWRIHLDIVSLEIRWCSFIKLMKSLVSFPLSGFVWFMYIRIWWKTHNVSSAGKACRTIEGGVYPGRLCFTCSGNKNSNEDSSCFIRVISSMCRLYPLWAETRAINISNFNERVLRSRLLAVPIESRYVSTGCTSQVVWYFGLGGLDR
jgi:hypothetical protein